MFKSSLEICSQGYNIEQTDYYIANLEDRIAFAENAYADSVKLINALEEQNRILTNELNIRLMLIAEKLGVELPPYPATDYAAVTMPDNADNESDIDDCIQVEEEIFDESDENFTNLKSQIDELKALFENK